MPSCRLWVILAREAPIAVIFRRGPSRQVQLIKWDLRDDTFEYGQWLKGRIYERRCDLSPKGTLLIYFAASFKKPLYSWTAISKPPWLSAVALWPKGDGWNGGGYFVGPWDIHLDHFPKNHAPHPDFVDKCRLLNISSLATRRGEDAPVWDFTRQRDGWTLVTEGEWSEWGKVKGCSWKAIIPSEWRKPHPKKLHFLQMRIEGIGEDNGPWYMMNYRVLDKDGNILSDLGASDWADWDRRGDLLFAKEGGLYRQKIRSGSPPILLEEFGERKFEAIEAPHFARNFK